MGVIILFFALLTAAMLHWVEETPREGVPESEWPYATYFDTITQVGILLVSGYDAEPPKHPMGYLLSMACMFMGIALLALLTADLASVLVTAALAGKGHQRVRCRSHLVVHGWHHATRILLEQLLDPDEGVQHEVVVIDEALATPPFYDPDVHFLSGDPTEIETLRRASLQHAETAIVPLDGRLPELLQDPRAALSVMAIKAVNRSLYTCAEVLLPHNRQHLERTGADEVVCVGDLSQKLLGHVVLSHGSGRLMEELLTFSGVAQGYSVPLPDTLAGCDFRWLLRRLNRESQTILLAVQRGAEITINPKHRLVLAPGDQLFVLAESRPSDLEWLAPHDADSPSRGDRPTR